MMDSTRAEIRNAQAAATPAEGVLSLRGFGVAFRDRVVLSSVDLEIPARGVTVLLGPAGTGKSTLLRTLAGFNGTNPSMRTWGEAVYAGAPLGTGDRPALVAQSARLLMASVLENIASNLPERRQLTPADQRALVRRLLDRAGVTEAGAILDEEVVRLPLVVQRHIAVLRQAAAGTRLLCGDELTEGLSDEDSLRLLSYLKQLARSMAVLLVLHNQEQARFLGGDGVLLAGGVVQEVQPIPDIFDAPRSQPMQQFARFGTCAVPAPDTPPEALDEAAPVPARSPEAARHYVSDSFGPRGFLWLEKGVLAGTPRPGVVLDAQYDLEALKRVGVDHLITLTEDPLDAAMLAPYGIQSSWFPIRDMGAPGIEHAEAICAAIDRLTGNGCVVAVHCHAGLGRTGTVLAAYLIWHGMDGLAALDRVRRIEPRWVQSDVQVAFLEAFARSRAGRAPSLPSPPPSSA